MSFMKLLSAFQFIILACPLDDLSLFHISSLWDMTLPLCSSLVLPVLPSFKLSWSLSLSVISKAHPTLSSIQQLVWFEIHFPSSGVNLKLSVIDSQHGIQLRCVYHSSICFLRHMYLHSLLFWFLNDNNLLAHTCNHSTIFVYWEII